MNDNNALVVIPAIPAISPEAEIRTVDGKDWIFYAGVQITPLGRKKSLDDHWCHPEPGFQVGRCKMIKRDGGRCSNGVRVGWTVCWKHGAGRPSKPGGLTNVQVSTGRHARHLPAHLLDKYDAYLTDPDTLVMAGELALIDTRVAELLERLEFDNADVVTAWVKVSRAYNLLDEDEIDEDTYVRALGLLHEAMTAKQADSELWKQIVQLVESRRKVAESERRRIVDSQQVMTVQEANIFVAFLMDSVMRNVTDPEEKRAISEDLKRVML